MLMAESEDSTSNMHGPAVTWRATRPEAARSLRLQLGVFQESRHKGAVVSHVHRFANGLKMLPPLEIILQSPKPLAYDFALTRHTSRWTPWLKDGLGPQHPGLPVEPRQDSHTRAHVCIRPSEERKSW